MANRRLRVFVASPGDVSPEREALAKLIADLNQTIAVVAPEKGISLEVVRWETHAVPAAGRPQAVISEQIGEYDIFVGIMWTRFGTPTGVAESGTKEEFDLAYEAWRKHGRPHIMFYFCQAPTPPPASRKEARQWLRVAEFRQELSEKALGWVYERHEDFADTVRPHLLQVLRKAFVSEQPAGELIAPPVPESDVAFAESMLRDLAKDYARIREDMPPGNARTRQMEIFVTKMRSVALGAVPLLPTLAASTEPGERLAAIAILQATPQGEWLDWLGDRCLERQPFVAYHAAVALLTSVRALDCTHRRSLEAAIRKGLDHLANKQHTDRYRTLSSALKELEERCPQGR